MSVLNTRRCFNNVTGGTDPGTLELGANCVGPFFQPHFRMGTPIARSVRKAMGLSEIAMLPKKLRRRISR
jgi:hypothetical protein